SAAGDDPDDDLPILQLLRRFRDGEERVTLMVLTHPHEDHADGFGHLVTELDPEWIGVTSANPPAPSLQAQVEAAMKATAADSGQEGRLRSVEAAFKAIAAWRERHQREVTPLHDGVAIALGATTVSVRSPTVDTIAALTADGWPAARPRANELSSVLELTFGATRLLFGGDLPHTRGGRVLDQGWKGTLGRHPHLEGGAGLKVPHHGSREALFAPMLDAWGSWWVTPFARQRLPRGGAKEGMAGMLAHHSPVQVTALPTRKAEQHHVPPPARLTLSEWTQVFDASDLNDAFARLAVETGPARGAGPLDAVWAASFDDQGRCVARWRGRVALDVVP
ncbi:MAG: MBL fold metallo-hydrolase, partial [Myxococcales bacterium]|nr:MBL fold metallo-hydrolase [Myxococcales bacterium]